MNMHMRHHGARPVEPRHSLDGGHDHRSPTAHERRYWFAQGALAALCVTATLMVIVLLVKGPPWQ